MLHIFMDDIIARKTLRYGCHYGDPPGKVSTAAVKSLPWYNDGDRILKRIVRSNGFSHSFPRGMALCDDTRKYPTSKISEI